MAVSDRIIVMEKGEVAQDGTPQDLYEHPRSKFIAGFIGEANLMPCTVERAADGRCHAVVNGVQVAVPPTDLEGEATLVIRPEATTLSPAGAPNAIPATVTSVAYLGDRVYYGLSSALGPLFHIEHTSSVRHPRASDVAIQLDAVKLRVVK